MIHSIIRYGENVEMLAHFFKSDPMLSVKQKFYRIIF